MEKKISFNWDSLAPRVSESILNTVAEMGFTKMTSVQAACIPNMLNYKDVVVEAMTGSGKTLAFLIPLLQILLRRGEWKSHEVGAIVIAPTRELAYQISDVLKIFIKHLPNFQHALFIGGTLVEEDLQQYRDDGGNILVVTPGRLYDLLMRPEGGLLKSAIKHLEVLILDEADCLLNMGFEKVLNGILQMLPKQRRTGLFSATQTTEVAKLIRAGLRNPVSIGIVENSTLQTGKSPASLENFVCIVNPHLKLHVLLSFIRKNTGSKILIFFSTCACVDYFSLILKHLLKKAVIHCLHGKMKEKHRMAVFEKFRESDAGVMCCTDVMARGIDITKRIHWVIQFDPPSNPASFIHRAGRTARNGSEGNALLMLMPSEEKYIAFLQISQKVTVQNLDVSDFITEQKWETDLKEIHKFNLSDKKLYDKSMRAFVSYFKAYSKYECNLILQIKDLDIGGLATAYGLVKFPKMAELKGKIPENFTECDVDINSLTYKDKVKESSRKRKLEEYKNTGHWPTAKVKKHKEQSAWSQSKDKKQKRKVKMLKKKKNNSGLSLDEISSMEKALKSS